MLRHWALWLACLLALPVPGVAQDYQTVLQQAQLAFSNGRYEEANKRFEDARRLAQNRMGMGADVIRITLLQGDALIMLGDFSTALQLAEFVGKEAQADAGSKTGAACLAGDANTGLASYPAALDD